VIYREASQDTGRLKEPATFSPGKLAVETSLKYQQQNLNHKMLAIWFSFPSAVDYVIVE
jgi:hypothetical protein